MFGIGEARQFKSLVLIDMQKYWCMHDTTHKRGVFRTSELCDLFKFWEISDNILLMVQDRGIVAIEHCRKLYATYQMAPLSMPLNDPEGHFWCLKPF